MAYPNGLIASETSNDSEGPNKSRIVEGNLFKNLKLDGLKILEDFSVPITEKEGVKEILSKQVGELFGHFSKKSKGMPSISYYIVHEGGKLSFVKFNVVESNSDDKQGDASVLDGDCPDGLELIEVCYSKSCVEKTLRELEDGFDKGKTIYIHHDGLGGVIICSDVK